MEEKKLLNEEELGITSGTAELRDPKILILDEATSSLPGGGNPISRFRPAEHFIPLETIGPLAGGSAGLLTDSAVAGVSAGAAENDAPNGKDRIIQRYADVLICNASAEYAAAGTGGPSRNVLIKSEYAEDDADAASYGKRARNGVIIVT